MSIYYVWHNKTKNQILDPLDIGSNGSKFSGSVYGDAPKVLAFLMATDWEGDHVVLLGDNQEDEYEAMRGSSKNITKEAILEFNQATEGRDAPPLKYTGEDS